MRRLRFRESRHLAIDSGDVELADAYAHQQAHYTIVQMPYWVEPPYSERSRAFSEFDRARFVA